MTLFSFGAVFLNISYGGEIHFCHGAEKKLLNKKMIKHTWFINKAVSEGLNLNCTDEKNGNTPLIIAAKNNFLESVRDLVDHEAAVNQKNVYGHTAVYYAEMMKHTMVAQYLYQHGANIQMSTQ